MNRLLLMLTTFAALLACTGTQTRECGQSRCAGDERCDVGSSLCVRDEAPVVTLDALPRVSTEAVLKVTGAVRDDVAVSALEWSLDDGATWTPVAAFGAQFSFEATLGSLDSDSVTLTVRATDSLGQQGSAMATVVVDDVPPTVTLVPLVAPARGSTVSLELDVEDGSDAIAAVTADFGDGQPRAASREGAHWQVSGPVAPNLDLRQVPVKVTAEDGHGLVTTATVSFPADTRGPVGGFAAPVAGAVLIGHGVEVHVTGTDLSGLAKVSVGFEGEQPVPATLTGGEWVASVALPSLDHVARQVVATLTDGVGNQTAFTVGVVVDSVGPAVSITTPVGDTVVGGATLVVTGVVGTDAAAVTVALGARPAVPATLSGSSYSASLLLPLEDYAAEVVTVTAVDSVGNVSATSTWIWVDGVKPVLTVSGLSASRLYGIADLPGGTVSFTVQVSDGDAQAAASWSVGGGNWVQGSAVSVATSPTDNGVQYVVTLRAQDRAGNVATQIETFTVDRVAPVVSFTAPAVGLITKSDLVTASVTVSEPAAVSFSLGTATPVAGNVSGLTASAALGLPMVDFSTQTISAVARDAAGNTGSASRDLTVDRIAPVLNVTVPTEGQKLGIADFGGSSAAVRWTTNDLDTQLTYDYSLDGVTWAPVDIVHGLNLPTSPLDNGRTYTVKVRCTDRALNQAIVTRTFSVDRVAPTMVSLVPADQARNVDPVATVTFSEPVFGPTTSSEAFTLTPAPSAAGTWDASHTVFSAPLGNYQVHQLTGAVGLTDAHGNPVAAPFSARFHTVAKVPASGTTIASAVDRFWVTSDGDGIPLLAYRQTSGAVTVVNWDAAANTFTEFMSSSDPRTQGSEYRVSLSAYATVQPDLTALRNYGATTNAGGSGYQSKVSEQGTSMDGGWALYVATPPIVSGVDGSGVGGVVVGSTYSRAPGVSVMMHGPPQSMLAASPSRWASLRLLPGQVTWDEYACTSNLFGTTSCSFFSGGYSGSTSILTSHASVAMSPDGSCFATTFYGSPGGATGRILTLQGPRACTRGVCVAGPLTIITGAPKDLQLAQSWLPGGGLLGAWAAPIGPLLPDSVHLGISSTCDGSFTEIPVSPGLGLPTQFQPVQLGNKPALLYIDAAANLKVYVP